MNHEPPQGDEPSETRKLSASPTPIDSVPEPTIVPPPPPGLAPTASTHGNPVIPSDDIDVEEVPGETMMGDAMPTGFFPYVRPMKVFDAPADEQVWAAATVSKNRETMSSTSAARGCIDTDLPDDEVSSLFAKLGLKAEQKGALWVFYGSGERVASTFADLNTELCDMSARRGILLPRVYLDTYASDNASPVGGDFLTVASQMLMRCVTGSVIASDTFHSLLNHPRVQIYLQKKVKGHGLVENRKVYLLSEFTSVINELRAGGAEKQYGRDEEMKQMMDWMMKFMGAETPMFSSLTIHGDAMMGKTRMAEEMIKATRAIQKKIEEITANMRQLRANIEHYLNIDSKAGNTKHAIRIQGERAKLDGLQQALDALPKHLPHVIFIPAKDTRMGDSLSFFRTYAKQIFDAAQKVFAGDALPDECKALQEFDSFDATKLSKDGPQILIDALRILQKSGNRFLIVTDDMQWADSESCDLLKQTFAENNQGEFGHLALLNLTRSGDEVMNQELLQILQHAPNPGELRLKPLRFLDERGTPTPLLVSFVCGLLKIDPAHTSIDTIVFERLGKAVGGAQGNPGLLTEMVNGMVQEGILSVKRASVTYNDQFLSWTTMGEADVLAARRVDRLLAKPLQKEVLRYIMFLRETGECTYQFVANFFHHHLKRPDLLAVFGQLKQQEVFNLQKIEEGNDSLAVVGFARDTDSRRLRSVFGDPASAQDEETLGAYKDIARYMLFTRSTLSPALDDAKNAHSRDAFLAVLDRCSPYALYAMATKANMREMVKAYVLDAFKDSYARGQFDVALSIYEYMKSEPDLAPVALAFDSNVDLQLDLIQCMQVKRTAYAAEVELLGDKVRSYYIDRTCGLQKNQTLSAADHQRIDRLYNLMCDFYFLRGSDASARKTSVEKLKEWGKGFISRLPEDKKQVFPLSESSFMELRSRFHDMRAEYLVRHYVQACESFDLYDTGRIGFLRQYPEFADDIRFQRVDLEANRIFANAFHEGWNRAVAPCGDGYYPDLIYNDDDAADFAAMFPDNSLRSNLETAREHFIKFLNAAHNHPEFVPDRTQLYRSRLTLGVIEGRLGHFDRSMRFFFDARSDCVKFGDIERYAHTLMTMGSALPKLVQYHQMTKDPAACDEIFLVADLIERNEPGATLSNKGNVATASYFILQWAAHYSALSATTLLNLANSAGSPVHKFYHDVALINLLGVVSTAAETASFFGDAVDDSSYISSCAQLSVALDDAIRRITQILPGEEKSFLDTHRTLDENGKPGDFWSLYIAPFLARIMRHASRLHKYQDLIDIVTVPDASKATLADAIPVLAGEVASLTNENSFIGRITDIQDAGMQEPPRLKVTIPQYVTVLERKISDLAIATHQVNSYYPAKKEEPAE